MQINSVDDLLYGWDLGSKVMRDQTLLWSIDVRVGYDS